MITHELKESFSGLARLDHLNRVGVVLTELDIGHGYSQRPGFNATLDKLVSTLAEMGLCGAVEQACAIFCLLSNTYSLSMLQEIFARKESLDELEQRCVNQHARQEVLQSALAFIKQKFAGLGRFDEVWLATSGNVHTSHSSTHSTTALQAIDLPCSYDGLIDCKKPLLLNEQVNCMHTNFGFQHPVSERFTPSGLIRQVCLQALPHNTAAISAKPIVAQCNFGTQTNGAFKLLNAVELIDARQLQYKFEHSLLECPANEIQAIQTRWESVVISGSPLSDAQVLVEQPLLDCSLEFKAAWEKVSGSFQFKVKGQVLIALKADSIQWHANCNYKGQHLYFALQPEQNLSLEWSFNEAWAEGLLPFGTPFLLREQKIPVYVKCVAPLATGQAVLSRSTASVGHLVLNLQGVVNAQTHCIELKLSLSHTEFKYSWHFADALLGWSSGSWLLQPEANVASWSLIDG